MTNNQQNPVLGTGSYNPKNIIRVIKKTEDTKIEVLDPVETVVNSNAFQRIINNTKQIYNVASYVALIGIFATLYLRGYK